MRIDSDSKSYPKSRWVRMRLHLRAPSISHESSMDREREKGITHSYWGPCCCCCYLCWLTDYLVRKEVAYGYRCRCRCRC